MKNVTTHETASRLKAAGFPQPEPEAGQFWYDSPGRAFTVLNVVAPGVCDAWWHYFGTVERWSVIGVFAPTAADIQSEYPYLVCAKFPHATHWEAWDYMAGTRAGLWSNANPAEACAAAWLELKKQKTKQ